MGLRYVPCVTSSATLTPECMANWMTLILTEILLLIEWDLFDSTQDKKTAKYVNTYIKDNLYDISFYGRPFLDG